MRTPARPVNRTPRRALPSFRRRIALAKKQKTCPVSDELLGEHGKPVKISVKGQTVFLCCSGCEPAIKKDPDKYLAKLKAKQAK